MVGEMLRQHFSSYPQCSTSRRAILEEMGANGGVSGKIVFAGVWPAD